MANNYLNFSVAVEFNPDKLEQLKELDEWNDCIFNNDVERGDEEIILSMAPEFARQALQESNYIYSILEYESYGFITTFYKDEYFVYCEECGNVETAVNWIETLLKLDLIQPRDGYVVFAWAETCDKPRVDEFSGGCAMISKIGVRYQHNAWEWAKDTYNEIKRNLAYQHSHQEKV